jgi:hypothetical protein
MGVLQTQTSAKRTGAVGSRSDIIVHHQQAVLVHKFEEQLWASSAILHGVPDDTNQLSLEQHDSDIQSFKHRKFQRMIT